MLGVILLEVFYGVKKLKMENLKKKIILFLLNKSRTNKKQETKDTIITLNILIFFPQVFFKHINRLVVPGFMWCRGQRT